MYYHKNKNKFLRVNPTLVFDGRSFEHESKYGLFIPSVVNNCLYKLFENYNSVAVYSQNDNLLGRLKDSVMKPKRVFPSRIVLLKKGELNSFLRYHGSPIIFFNELSEPLKDVSLKQRLRFSTDIDDMLLSLRYFESGLVDIIQSVSMPVKDVVYKPKRYSNFKGKFS